MASSQPDLDRAGGFSAGLPFKLLGYREPRAGRSGGVLEL
jgi:hypothetical protein